MKNVHSSFVSIFGAVLLLSFILVTIPQLGTNSNTLIMEIVDLMIECFKTVNRSRGNGWLIGCGMRRQYISQRSDEFKLSELFLCHV